MKNPARHALFAAACAAALLINSGVALSQEWPTAPITLVMTFPPGSGIDVVGRTLQESMQKSLGQNIVFDYRPGAGGNVASEHVARSKPDGYTILFGTAATHGVNRGRSSRSDAITEAVPRNFSPSWATSANGIGVAAMFSRSRVEM